MTPPKQFYFVTGLPRCRSAWVANYLTWGDSICYHDAFWQTPSFAAFCEMLDTTPAMHVGHADPANLLVWEKLVKRFPNAKWIVIIRDVEETLAACQKAFGDFSKEQLQFLIRQLGKLSEAVEPFCVNFENLNGQSAAWFAQELGIQIPNWRGHFLNRYQVQIEPSTLKREIVHFQSSSHWLKEAV